MLLTVENVHTSAQGTAEELDWLHTTLVYRDPTARFRANAQERVPLFDRRRCRFPSGLVSLAVRRAAKEGLALDVRDARPPPPALRDRPNIRWLYEYQEEAVEACIAAGRGIVQVPTGGGKTEVFGAVVHLVPCRWLVFVHRADLMHQAAERIERRTGEPCGLWGDGVFRPGRVIVATFKTVALALAARERTALRLCADAEGVIVDECHTLAADEAYRVLGACPNAFYRFGFSGTPLSRSDRKGALVIAATGEIIYKMKAAALVAAGVVAQPTVHLVPCAVKPDPTRDYRTAHTGAMTAHHRERMAVAILKRAPKPCIAFIRDIAHGESLEVAVRAAGFRTELVSGRNPTKQRQASIRRVAEGETDVLISSVVFQEGIDLPELKSVALLAGGKSHIAALQNIGRGMRRKDRFGRVVKDAVPIFELTDTPCGTCEVLDRVTGENHYRHSLCRWVHAHAKERRRAYRGAGYPLVEGIP